MSRSLGPRQFHQEGTFLGHFRVANQRHVWRFKVKLRFDKREALVSQASVVPLLVEVVPLLVEVPLLVVLFVLDGSSLQPARAKNPRVSTTKIRFMSVPKWHSSRGARDSGRWINYRKTCGRQ
jgi:hypothetical protein